MKSKFEGRNEDSDSERENWAEGANTQTTPPYCMARALTRRWRAPISIDAQISCTGRDRTPERSDAIRSESRLTDKIDKMLTRPDQHAAFENNACQVSTACQQGWDTVGRSVSVSTV